MAKQLFICRNLTGGIKGCLDYIPGPNINNGDCAITITNESIYFHEAEKRSDSPQQIPYLIKPKHDNQSRRWRLTHQTNSYYYLDKNVLKGYSFFGDPPDPAEPGFVFWLRDLGNNICDLCVKIRNRFNRLKQFTVARFEYMTPIPNSSQNANFPSLGKTLHKKLGLTGGGPNDLNGTHDIKLNEDDYAIVSTETTLYFYVLQLGEPEPNFPSIIYPKFGYGEKYWKLIGAIGDMSFDLDTSTEGSALNDEPPNPPPGTYIMWMSSGSGLGDVGDFFCKITDSDNRTRYKKLVDFSWVSPNGTMIDPNKTLSEVPKGLDSVEIVNKDVVLEINDSLFGDDSTNFIDHSGVFIDDFGYLDETQQDVIQQIVIADYDSSSDKIDYLEKVKHVKVYDNKRGFDYALQNMDIFLSDFCSGQDDVMVYVQSEISDSFQSTDLLALTEAQTKIKDEVFHREKPIKIVLDLSDASDIILIKRILVVTQQALGTESLVIQNEFQIQEDVEVPDERAWNSRIYCIVDDIISKSLGYNFFISEEAAPTVDKPDVTVDFSTGTTTPTFYGSSFEVSGDDTSNYTHVASDWKVLSEDGGLIFKSLDDTSNLTELQMPSSTLFEGKKYVVYLRYEEQDLGKGSWGRKWFEV